MQPHRIPRQALRNLAAERAAQLIEGGVGGGVELATSHRGGADAPRLRDVDQLRERHPAAAAQYGARRRQLVLAHQAAQVFD